MYKYEHGMWFVYEYLKSLRYTFMNGQGRVFYLRKFAHVSTHLYINMRKCVYIQVCVEVHTP